jgi:hypothetical protein
MVEAPAGDPVTRWATEHYGFDDAVEPIGSGAPSTPQRPPGRRGSRRVLVGSGVLGFLLVGGEGGVAVAAAGDDGGGGGGRGGDQAQDEFRSHVPRNGDPARGGRRSTGR